MYKNNPSKVPSKELNSAIATLRGRSICDKCKRESILLYNGICPSCLDSMPQKLGDVK